MCIVANCSWSLCIVCIFVTSFALFYYVCIAVLHTLFARLLARSQNPGGPAADHLDTANAVMVPKTPKLLLHASHVALSTSIS